MESITASNPQEVGANISDQPSHVVVPAVQHPAVFGERCEPQVGGDVVSQNTEPFGADVGDVAYDFHNCIASLGPFAPIGAVLEV